MEYFLIVFTISCLVGLVLNYILRKYRLKKLQHLLLIVGLILFAVAFYLLAVFASPKYSIAVGLLLILYFVLKYRKIQKKTS